MPTWPTLLPAPSIDFGVNLDNSKLRTPMDSGRFRQRNRFSRENRNVPVSWEFDSNEFAFFQSFYLYKLSGGADFFDISLPFGGGMRTFAARFSQDWQAKYVPVDHWRVNAVLEVEDARILSEADFDTLVTAGSLATLPTYLT